MTITENISGSCVGAQIQQLSAHTTGEDAMIAFCKSQLGNPALPGGFRTATTPRYGTLGAFYTFTCGPEEKGGPYGGGWANYATSFAEFIKANDLGEVVTPGKRENKRNHPGRDCQAFLWAPDQTKLEAWWDEKNAVLIAEAKAKKEAEEKARAELLSKMNIVRIGKVMHHGAMTQDKPVRYDKSEGCLITVHKVLGTKSYHKAYNGESQYVSFGFLGALPLKENTTYIIIKADPISWELGELQPLAEGEAQSEDIEVTLPVCSIPCGNRPSHCFCNKYCCYCSAKESDVVTVETSTKKRSEVFPTGPEVVAPKVEPVVEEIPF